MTKSLEKALFQGISLFYRFQTHLIRITCLVILLFLGTFNTLSEIWPNMAFQRVSTECKWAHPSHWGLLP